ncbi:MucB/RseB C-terminal domain-containing protein [Paraphotobacterium marinum]|uniref:MucB/RseB C-terminal domain-containing protein n=1 Tax=Paraphotobacterium marinum TaxID=1755811 RepID=UPI00298F0E22|nr:MucB/RseB C-terminal domain-containing protein [Paraphotobacterium marinum]
MFFIIFFNLFNVSYAVDIIDDKDLLQEITSAASNKNYILDYVYYSPVHGIIPLRYEHLTKNNKEVDSLSFLSTDTSIRKIINHDNEQEYFFWDAKHNYKTNYKPFRLFIPPFNKGSYKTLLENYNIEFIRTGIEANRKCSVYKISSKYNNTYSYLIWVDSKSRLILRANLINSRNLLLEEFRVLSSTILPPSDNDNENDKKLLVNEVNSEKYNSESFDWHSNWIPQGFQKFNSTEYKLKLNGKKVQVKMYTDHLFYFSIYFTHGESTQNVENRVVKLGPQIMESKNLNGNLVTVIGSLPLKTINKILKNVSSESTN